MKTSTFLSIEIFGLLIGLLSAQVLGIGVLLLPLFTGEAFVLFDSTNPVSILLTLLITAGVIGSVFFLFNLFWMRLVRWHYRLIGFAIFYLTLGIIGITSI